MKRYRWVVVSVLFFVLGVGSLAEGWNGTASARLASPTSAMEVNSCCSALGWPALIGTVGLLLGLLFLSIALVAAGTKTAGGKAST